MDPRSDPPLAVTDAHGPLMSTTTPDAVSPSSPPPVKRRRTAASLADCCRTCRLRKVKCTGNPGYGPCTNCARLELACPFTLAGRPVDPSGKVSRTTPSHSHTEAGTLRKRAQRACSQCHSHKTKCSGDLPRCKRCEASNLSCEYTAAKRKFANVPLSSSPAQPKGLPSVQAPRKSEGSGISPDNSKDEKQTDHPFALAIDTTAFAAEDLLFRKNLILTHLDAYFNYLYHVPCMGFFHPGTIYGQVHDGTLDPATAAAMVAVTSFFVDPSKAGREFGMKCSDEVEFFIFRNIYRFAEETLVLYALNGVFNFFNGSLAKVWQCYGIAVRSMLGLQVNWDVLPRNRTFAQQECTRRIVWQLFHMDRLLAGGYEEYISCRDEIMRIRLPCNETAFRENRTVAVERLHDRSTKNKGAMGLHGYQIRIIDIRHRIKCLARKLGGTARANRSQVEPSKVMADINTLQNELSQFNASLPDEYRLNDQNILHFIASEDGPGYFFLHCSLGSSHIDLYSIFLPGLQERISGDVLRKLPREFVFKCQKQAIAHTLCTSRYCDTIQREVDKQPSGARRKLAGDPSILNVTTQCLRVLLVAIQHGFHQDLTLADQTTAPLWRNEPADETHIRGLIDSLLKISAAWCRFVPKAQQSHDTNTAAVEQFNKTRKFADKRSAGSNQSAKAVGSTRLPGPHHILDHFTETEEDEQRSKAGDAAAADRWFRTPQPPNEPVPCTLPEADFDIEYGPPAMPMFLAQARGFSLGPTETLNMYDAANDLLSMSTKMIPMGDFNGMLPAGNHLGLPAEGIPLMHMDSTTGDAAIFHAQQPPPHAQYMPPPHGMFMEGYGSYPGSQADSTPYMQQNGFG